MAAEALVLGHLMSLLQALCEVDYSKESVGKEPHSKEAGAEGKREEREREGEEWRSGGGAENVTPTDTFPF